MNRIKEGIKCVLFFKYLVLEMIVFSVSQNFLRRCASTLTAVHRSSWASLLSSPTCLSFTLTSWRSLKTCPSARLMSLTSHRSVCHHEQCLEWLHVYVFVYIVQYLLFLPIMQDIDVDPKEMNRETPEETGIYFLSRSLPQHCLYTRVSALQKLKVKTQSGFITAWFVTILKNSSPKKSVYSPLK